MADIQEAPSQAAEATESTSRDPLEIRASELMGMEIDNDPPADEEEEVDEETEEPSDEETEDESADEESEEESEEEDEYEDLPLTEKLKLDDNVRKRLSKEQAKRYDDQVKGLAKFERQLGERGDHYNKLVSWENSLGVKETAADALKQLVTFTAQQHGFDLAELFGLQAKASEREEAKPTSEGWAEAGYDSPKEMELDLKAKELQTRLDALEKKFGGIEGESKAAKEKREFEQYIETRAPKAISFLQGKYDGWTVTKEMISEAVQAFPQFKDKPGKATAMYFADSLARHMATGRVKKAPRGPETPTTIGREGKTLPSDPLKIRASDILGS